MADKGFLEDLGIGSTDEEALLQAQRAEMSDANRLGASVRPLLGAVMGGVGLISGKNYAGGQKSGRSFNGFLSNVEAGIQGKQDLDTARAAGISVEDLRARRQIRKEFGSPNLQQQAGEDAYDYRERLAARAASIAAASGSARQQAAALEALKRVRDERFEFEKMNAEQKDREQNLTKDGIMTGWDENGKPISGTLSYQIDEETGKRINGIEYVKDGQLVFKPWSDTFTAEDPAAGTLKETPDQRMRRAFGKGHVDETRSMIQANAEAMRKIARVTSSVKTYVEAGIDEAVLGKSGGAINWVDNGIRNIRGFIGAFLPQEEGKRAQDRSWGPKDTDADPQGLRGGRNGWGYQGRDSWMAKAKNAKDSIWDQFQLPEWARGISAEAQEHRAQILELAYMAARLAEPSNRGLSDKDIEAALARIAGDTSNPQQLLRRFVSIAADAAYNLEDRLDSYKQAIPGIGEDEVDSYFGGKLLTDYRQRRTELFENLGVEFDSSLRPRFNEVVDIQFSPEGQLQTPANPGAKPVEEMTEEEMNADLEALFNIPAPAPVQGQ